MTRRILPRLLTAAATLVGLVAVVTLFAGTGFAGSSAAQANYAPTSTTPPTISGTPQTGQVLTASTGGWSYQTTPTYTYQWLRCDANGAACVAIGGATAATHQVVSDDVGHTLRVTVSAQNAQGAGSSTSAQTAVVTNPGPEGAIKLPNGKTSIPATSVALPARLVIDGVQYQPRSIRGRGTFLARYHVSDTRGYVVRGALLYALGIPYAWVTRGVEVQTDQDGWATVTVTPTTKMPRRGALMMFVRARVAGQDLLAGTSTRRLSQILIR
jgi:hypothetical protein